MARRATTLARDLGIPHVYAVANKVLSERDEAAVREYCAKHDLEVVACVPFDEAISEADRAGIAVIDHDPDAPAVAAIRLLTHRLENVA